MEKYHQYTCACVNHPVEYGTIAAFLQNVALNVDIT